jgi:dihydroorotate dehydrogenase electron transfer subunit
MLRANAALAALPLYACGPEPMLHALSKVVAGKGMQCYVSLEEYMACGMGACLGCVTATTSGYKRVCKEGPVFSIEEMVWK